MGQYFSVIRFVSAACRDRSNKKHMCRVKTWKIIIHNWNEFPGGRKVPRTATAPRKKRKIPKHNAIKRIFKSFIKCSSLWLCCVTSFSAGEEKSEENIFIESPSCVFFANISHSYKWWRRKVCWEWNQLDSNILSKSIFGRCRNAFLSRRFLSTPFGGVQ